MGTGGGEFGVQAATATTVTFVELKLNELEGSISAVESEACSTDRVPVSPSTCCMLAEMISGVLFCWLGHHLPVAIAGSFTLSWPLRAVMPVAQIAEFGAAAVIVLEPVAMVVKSWELAGTTPPDVTVEVVV